jgi:hypothetical protein
MLPLLPVVDMTPAAPVFLPRENDGPERHASIEQASMTAEEKVLFNAPQKATHSQSSCRSRNTLIIETIDLLHLGTPVRSDKRQKTGTPQCSLAVLHVLRRRCLALAGQLARCGRRKASPIHPGLEHRQLLNIMSDGRFFPLI